MNDPIQPAGPSSGLVDRAKSIIVSPNTEWPKIAAENTTPNQVLVGYALPLLALGAICSVLGSFLAPYSLGLGYYLASALVGLVLGIVGLYVLSFIANFISPKFGGKHDYSAAFKLVAYAYTPTWVAGILGLLVGIAPAISILVFVALLYGLYLFYLGATPVMGVPKDKSAGYTVVYVIAAIVLYFIIGAITLSIVSSFIVASGPAVVVYR